MIGDELVLAKCLRNGKVNIVLGKNSMENLRRSCAKVHSVIVRTSTAYKIEPWNMWLYDLIRSYYRQTVRFVNAICRPCAGNSVQNDVSKMSSDQLVAQLVASVQEGASRCRAGIVSPSRCRCCTYKLLRYAYRMISW